MRNIGEISEDKLISESIRHDEQLSMEAVSSVVRARSPLRDSGIVAAQTNSH